MEAVKKTVLCVCKGRRRPVTFSGSINTIEEDRMNLKKEIESAFKDVLQTDEGQIRDYYIERESKEWGGLIDLTGFVQDKEILHLNYSEAPYQCKDSGLQNEVIYHLAICIMPTYLQSYISLVINNHWVVANIAMHVSQ